MFKYLSKVLYIISGSRQKLLLLILGFTISSFLEACGIGLLAPFMQFASEPDMNLLPPFIAQISAQFNLDSSGEIIVFLGLAVVTFFCIKGVIYFSTQAYIFHFASSYKAKLSLRLLKAYLTVPYEFHLSRNTASLIKNIVIETNQLYQACLLPLLNTISNLVIASSLLVLLAITDLRLLGFILIVLLPIFIFFHLLRNKFKRWGRVVSQSQQGMIRAISHALGGLKETRVIGCEPYFEKEMEHWVNQYARSTTFFQSSQVLPKTLIETVLIVSIMLFLVATQLFSTQGIEEITGILSVFAVAAIRLIPSTSNVIKALAHIRNGAYALDMLYSDLKDIDRQKSKSHRQFFLDSDRTLRKDVETEERVMSFRNRIELKDVTYSYSGISEPALDRISLSIKRGESIAFIGKSGAGKTTLVDVILGLLNLESGDILVDGVSIYENIRSWQNLVGYIPQSIFLTDDTVERNIAFGVADSEIDKTKIERAIEAAQLRELVEQLPNGINTKVGERGIRLSGGQRQRIGIARALYHEREILVLDEATAALDNETEHLISEAIRALAGEKTLITIAHRLSTIEHCDRIYMLEKGRIVKTGSYQEVVLKAC